MGWLLGTIVKVVSCSGLGVMFTYLVAQELQPELATEVSSKIVTAIRRMGKNYISCIISWTDMSPGSAWLAVIDVHLILVMLFRARNPVFGRLRFDLLCDIK